MKLKSLTLLPGRLLAPAIAMTLAGHASAATVTGPSTGSTPYATPVAVGVDTYSIATVDNTGVNADDLFTNLDTGVPASYRMTGIPDGLGAFDNGDGTFTVLMNHEHGNTVGVVRAHGVKGSFVSKWVINKNTLAVVGGADLMKTVNLWNGSGYTSYNTASPMPNVGTPYNGAFGRFCSADLPKVSAFFNAASGLGTTARIFMNGEEIGAEGRGMAHIVTGPQAGISYELPRTGKFSWENSLACPVSQNKTVVIGTDDATPGQLYVYVGNKTNTGSEVDKAGLTNGLLYGIKVTGFPLENVTTNLGSMVKGGTRPFTMQILNTTGDVSAQTGAQLHSNSLALGVTEFLRPEDGAWDSKNSNRFYFVTTDGYNQVKDGVGATVRNSRLWVLEFTNITNPTAGGVIRMLIDGSETLANGGLNMMDNLGVDTEGNVTIVEDVGSQQHNGKFARYNTSTGVVEILARHDTARFGDIGTPSTTPYSQDEEFSGDIDITDIMAGSTLSSGDPLQRWYLFDDQAHYTTGITTEQVEGGQLLLMSASASSNPNNRGLVSRSGIIRDRLSGRYAQNIVVTNNTSVALSGPIYVAFDNLSANATVFSAAGTTTVLPAGSSYIQISAGALAAGASTAPMAVQFTNPTNAAINYYPRLINGVTP